jgi:hypothetical protein
VQRDGVSFARKALLAVEFPSVKKVCRRAIVATLVSSKDNGKSFFQ